MGETCSEREDDDSERDYDEDEEEEGGDGEGRGRQMLGFMFGNVDDSGGLDEEYLDEDAKEHLSALAHQLGPSFVDVESDVSGSEEHEDYDQKAGDAVDYEDIEERYEGPEVQLAPQDMQFYADAALAGATHLVEEDDYDEDDYSDSEQGASEDDYSDSEQGVSEIVDEACLTEDDEEELPSVQEQCRTSAVDVIDLSSDDEEEKEEDWDQILGLEESTSSTKEKEEEVAKVPLPVLCQEDGKDVVNFSELFGEQEPYWVIGHRKGRQKRGHTREERDRAEADPEAVEDDEEGELKRCSQRPPMPTADLSSAEGDFESESSSEDSQVGSAIEEDVIQTAPKLSFSRRNRFEQERLVFTAAEPMKVDIDFYESGIAESMRQIPDANFDPIHQVEWEDDILWDTPKPNKSISGHRTSCQLLEVDSESEQSDLSDIDHERPSTDQPDAELSDYSEWKRPFVIESLRQRSSELEDEKEITMPTKVLRHPQLLRLETHEQIDVEARVELLKRMSNMALEVKEKNQELARGDWLSSISWGEMEPGLPKPQVIFDLMDPQMVFETSDAKSGQSTCLHAAAIVLTPGGEEEAHDGAEGTVDASLSLTRFNISNDKYYTDKETHQQQNLKAKKRRAIHGVNVMHSLPAIKLQSVKPELSKKELSNFHRPKAVWYPHHNEVAAKEQGKLAGEGRMKVIVKTLGGKGSKLTVIASKGLDVLKAKIARKLGDLEPSEKTKVFYSGKELVDDFTFAQQQVPPNSVLHFVRTKIYPWPKAQRLPGEDKPRRPPGAFMKKSELSVKDGHVALMEYCEERPLLLGNVGMGGHLYTFYRKRSPTDATAFALRAERGPWVGTSLPLEPTDDSPFLGDIRPGETQSSLETNMYRAPVFPHKVATTDFLLVRSPKGKLSLRRIDSVHVVGQQEPHMEVLTPNSRSVRKYRWNRLLVYLYREFREKEKPGVTSPHVRADDVISQFTSLNEGIIRRRLQHCADLKQIGGKMCWVKRQNFRIPSEGEMRRLVTPENVCAYESMQAGLHQLKRMGVHKLTQPSGLAAAMNKLPNVQKTIAAASHIERVLQLTPWNLSNNFVAATMQGLGSLEQLEIVGAGDPSGRGLGFSYLRAATKLNNVGALVERKAAAARGGGALTGTDADLRRVGMEGARDILLKFKVPKETIDKLTRWRRIAMIRKLSSKQAASEVELGAAALNKFARGQRMSFLQLKQQTREKCQVIWDKQVQSLSMADGDDSESEGGASGDLDSFAADLENHFEERDGDTSGDLDSFASFLENHLEAAEGDEGGGKKGKREGMGGLGARLRKQIAQEEDIEDEEAEAAELMRMLRADDEAEEEQKRKRSVPASKEKELEDIEPRLDLGGDGQAGKKNASKTANQEGGADKDDTTKKGTAKHPFGSKELKKSGALMKEMSTKGKVSGKFGRNAFSMACGACGQFGHMRTNKICPLYNEEGGDSVAWQGSEAAALGLVERQGSGALMKEFSIKGKLSEKFGNALPLACGACGQLGHMRTNKKCPLYNEEGREPVAWQDSGAAALGLVERQGTKIIIKRKFLDSIPTKNMEELDLPKSVQPPVIKTRIPMNEIPSHLPLYNPPSILRTKIIKQSDANQNSDSSLPPFVSKPSPEKVEKLHGAHANVGAGETCVPQTSRPPLLKLKLFNQKQKDQGVERLNQDQDVEAARKDRESVRERERQDRKAYEERERIKEREAYKEALIEEREREEREREERERERKERDEREVKRKATVGVDTNEGAESSRLGNKGENKMMVFVHGAKDDPKTLLRRREREREQVELMERERQRQEVEAYQRTIVEELKREKEELDQKEERNRREQVKAERERHRQHMKKEKRREKRRLREEAMPFEADLKAQAAAREREEKERQAKNMKIKHMKERTRDVCGPPSGISGEKDRGKGIKRPSDVLPPAYHHTPDPKRLRKRGGVVDLCNILEGVVDTLKNADCSYLFLKPVLKKEAPDYLHYVRHPMDLSTILERVRKLKYKSRDDFRNDVRQIADNAHLYNEGRNPGIPPLADRLLELCDEELVARDEDLDDAEAGIVADSASQKMA